MRDFKSTALRVNLLALFCVLGCGEERTPLFQDNKVSRPAELSRRRERLGQAPGEYLPPPKVSSLKVSLEQLTSYQDCLRRIQRSLVSEVHEALADLAYDNFATDVCKGLVALKHRSAKECHALGTSAAVTGCMKRLALLTQNPSLCPSDAFLGGRDVLCLAWTLGQVPLCRGASLKSDQIRCRAVLTRRAGLCRTLAASAEQRRCEADILRYGDLITMGKQGEEAKAFFRLSGSYQRRSESQSKIFVVDEQSVARGLFLRAKGCRYEVEVGDTQGLSLGAVSALGQARAQVRLFFSLAAQTKVPVPLIWTTSLAELELKIPGQPLLTSRSAASGGAQILKLSAEPGAPVHVKLKGRLENEVLAADFEGELQSFVRDREPLSKACPRTQAK